MPATRNGFLGGRAEQRARSAADARGQRDVRAFCDHRAIKETGLRLTACIRSERLSEQEMKRLGWLVSTELP